MPLFQATNITPSSFAGRGSDVVDARYPIQVSWQLNGNAPLYAYQYRIMQNNVSGTQIFSTGKINLSNPLHPIDFQGKQQFFSFETPIITGMINGFTEGYKSEITQWWSNNDNDKIIQSSPSFFITRSNPILNINFFIRPIQSRIHEFTATYFQAESTRLNWFRWILSDGYEHKNIIKDTGNIHNSQDVRFIYDGFFASNEYSIKLYAETQDGVSIETDWIDFDVDYQFERISNIVRARQSCRRNAIEVDWSRLVVINGKPDNDDYSYLNNIPVTGHNSIQIGNNRIVFDEVTENPMEFEQLLNYIWSGRFEQSNYKPLQIFGKDDLGNKTELSLGYEERFIKGILSEMSIDKKEIMVNVPIIIGKPLNNNYRFISNSPTIGKASIQIDDGNKIIFDEINNQPILFPSGLTFVWNGNIQKTGSIFEFEGLDNKNFIHKIWLDLDETYELQSDNIYRFENTITIYLDNFILFKEQYEYYSEEDISPLRENFISVIIEPTITTVSIHEKDGLSTYISQTYSNITNTFGNTTKIILNGRQKCDYIWLFNQQLDENIYNKIIKNLSFEPLLISGTSMLCLFNNITNMALATISLLINDTIPFQLNIVKPYSEDLLSGLFPNDDRNNLDLFPNNDRNNIDLFPNRNLYEDEEDGVLADGWWTIAITPKEIYLNWFDWTLERLDNYNLRESIVGNYELFFIDNINGANANIPYIARFFNGGESDTTQFGKHIYGGNAFTTNPFYTTSVILNGKQKCDYLWITKDNINNDEIMKLKTLEFEPEWDINTLMLARFNNSLSAGNAFNELDTLIGIHIYRYDFKDNTFNLIAEKSLKELSFLDYGALSCQQYQYYFFPIGNSTFGQPILSEIITPIFNSWSLLDCDKDKNKENLFEVIAEYIFELNIESGTINNNINSQLLSNFTQYPNVQIGTQNYASGSLTSLTGYIENDEYIDDVDDMKRLFSIATNRNIKFLKDIKGNIWKILIPNNISFNINDMSIEQMYTTTINWIESGDAKNSRIIKSDFISDIL